MNPIQLNFGCGDQRLPEHFGLDILVRDGVDVVCDLNKVLPFAGNSVDHIYTKSLLEHIANLEGLLGELSRVLKPNGTLYIYVPHWTNPFYYSDYTHRRFFGLATFDYFAGKNQQKYRHVPVYSTLRFHTQTVRLLFYSPFRSLNWVMKGLQWLINRSAKTQLFYEFHLSSLFPCYAIEYTLRNPQP
jgi:predicted SAM-dependent methyltransferase